MPMNSKLRALFWVGVIVLFLPYIGLPDGWKAVLTIILGLTIIVLVFKSRREYKALKFQLRRYEQPSTEPIIHES